MGIIGIDLGTTNSAMAYYEDGEAHIVTNDQDQRTTPSVYQVKPNGEEVIGLAAKKGAATFANRTVLEVKRLMGTGEDVVIDGNAYRPEEISSKYLRYLKESAEQKLNRNIDEAVITVPAYFTDAQRKATKDAGELAGLTVERIINEPTAAALAFCHDNLDEDRHLLVYDLGGGTFDVSVVELFEGIVTVQSSVGDNELGGTDFDKVLANLILETFEKENGYPMETIAQDPKMLAYTIKEAAESAKIELSTQVEATIMIPFIGLKDNFPVGFNGTITRNAFEEAIRPYIDRTLEKVATALAEAGLTPSDIDEVLMVGGSTRVPAVQEAVDSLFGDKIRTDVNPDEVVAQGAAVQAGLKSGAIDASTGLMAIDVCPYTLGLSIVQENEYGENVFGVFDPLIEKNTPIPTKQTKTYYTMEDGQEEVHLEIYQGEARRVEDNTLVSDDIYVRNIPRNRAGAEQIQVTFHYDINGLINVEALVVSTGQVVKEVIESQQGVMSKEEKSQAVRRMEEEEHVSDAYDRAKKAIHKAERAKAACSEQDAARLSDQIAHLQAALEAEDVRAIERNEQKLLDLLLEVL
ncbi:MAG TPA: Hsp70 family protein [Savagea sp.]